MSKKWWIIIAVVLVFMLGFASWQIFSDRQIKARTPAETAVVRRGALLATVSATGSLVPHSEVALAFKSGGQVAEVLVEEGERVEASQILAKLEMAELELAVKQAEATLAMSETQLKQLEEDARAEDIAAAEAGLDAARANLTTAKGSLASAQANLDKLLAGPTEYDLKLAELEIENAKNALWGVQGQRDAIKGSSFTKPGEKDAAEASVGQGHVSVQMAQERYEQLKAGPTQEDIAMAQAQVDQAQGQVEGTQAQVRQAQAALDKLKNGATSTELANAQAQVDQAQAALEQARLRLEQATLTAPIDGTITMLNVEPGEIASPGQPVVVLSDLAALEVDVNLDETDVAQVAVGQKAEVTLDAFPGVELAGEVTTIAPTAQIQTGVVLYPVTIRLTPGDPSTGGSAGSPHGSGQALPVRAGMTADVDITTASQEDALIVPLRAIETEGEHAYVDRLVGDQIERVEVTLGMITDTEVEITGGLAEGDVVVVIPSAQGSAGVGPFGMFGGGE